MTSLPNIPWEEKPVNCKNVVWRSKHNPIIARNFIPNSNGIFNSAVVPFDGKFAGVFRSDDKRGVMNIHRGFSENGINWQIDEKPIEFICNDAEIGNFEYRYDPRVCWLEDRYYIIWCNGYHGPTVGIGWTNDFEKFYLLENAFLPYNRNGVLFPKKIKGKFAMLSRPSDRAHSRFGDIFYSESPDMLHWGKHRFVMGTTKGWQGTKIGAGPIPIETSEGWLLIYHGVWTSCNGFVYSAGAALLDLEQPWKVIHRAESFILTPEEVYECVGTVPNVVFPTAALVDVSTGRMCIYYGCADTATSIAYTRIQDLIDFIKSNSSK